MIIIFWLYQVLVICDFIRWLNNLSKVKRPVIPNPKVGTENAKQTQKNLDGGFSRNGDMGHPPVCRDPTENDLV